MAAVGVFTAGLGIGTMTAGPSPPSAAGMGSLKLRDDPQQGTENRLQAEQRNLLMTTGAMTTGAMTEPHQGFLCTALGSWTI